ncbi:MAG: trigger factor, partial [Myxococcota bacterium]
MSSKASAESEEVRVEIVESGPVQRTLQVEVEAVRVRKAFDRAYRRLGRSAQVRGFRRGKVPRSVLEKLYGASVAEDLERLLVAETLPDAIELAQVAPIGEPEIEGEKPLVDRSFRYTARIEIKPTIELPELTGLPATLPQVGVSDEDVERELAGLRDRNAPLLEEPEGTPAAEGHHVEVDFQGRIDGKPFEGGSGKDVVIEIGANKMIPGFEEQLVGAKSGEEREVRVQFRDDYQSEALRGKEALFTVQLKTLRRKQLPDLDDEFAKDLGPFEALEDLRERIRTDLLAARQREAQAALHRSLLDVLIERTSFEVPPGLVERRLRSQLASMSRQFEGRVPPEALRAQLLRIEEEGRPAAERRVRESLLLEAVAASQAIEASDDDVDARLAQMAEEQGIDA